ncbi:MAG: hypothetical protein ACI9G1_000554 [Pirellulaceae bacterium]|jgi:hypothetical protein
MAAEKTYRQRVLEFWEWFPTVAERFGAMLREQESDEIVPEISAKMEPLLPSLSWVLGGTEDAFSFTLTGQGQVAKQLLTEFWLSQSYELPNWTFYSSRQPTPIEELKDFGISLGSEQQVNVENLLIRTAVDEEAELIDITVWHPAFDNLDEEHHHPILFILLDEAFGEFGTQMYLGNVTIEPITEGADTRRLTDLPKFIQSVCNYHGWEKLSPMESYSGYQIREPGDFPRGDTLFGTTCVPYIIFDLLENKGRLPENPLAGTGAEFAYIAVDGSVFPEGRQVDVRGNIEDAIDEALREQASGRSLGGAFGANESYIEMLLLDGENSRQIVKDVLQKLQLADKSRLEFFV